LTQFPIPTPVSNPLGITLGPDGNLWFTESNAYKIGRITPAGGLTEFSFESKSLPPFGMPVIIAAGPDGALWFTEESTKRIGRVTTAGDVTEFPVATDGNPQFITAGSDGALWFTESGNLIARMSPSDPDTIVEYQTVLSASTLGAVTTGPDGNIWFTETDHASNSARVARVDLTKLSGCSARPSLCITEFVIPGEGGNLQLSGITSGADGALWFTATGKVGRITTEGAITLFPAASASTLSGITRGPDGALWYAGTGNKIGRITTSGALTEFFVSAAFTSPRGIAAGPDGNIWFTDINANKIIRLTPGVTGCIPDVNTLCLNNGRFKVTVAWRVPSQGTSGAGNAAPLTGDTGYFWFFSANNVELIVKVVDGRTLNNRFWVFFGALSDVEYTITVTDTSTGRVKTYFNSSGQLTSASDTDAFPGLVFEPPDPEESVRATAAPSGAAERAADAASDCTADETTLCLNSGRFQARVDWSVPSQGANGHGIATSITGDTGHYWFFSPNNIELIIKVVDGRAVNNKFWFFSGALTNVAYTITITDTQTGAVRTYTNPSGTQATLVDTSAF
jgi:virginiamycin B lyase